MEASMHQFVLYMECKRITPKIWRLVQMPANCTLGDLHDVIQILMDWDDAHLFQFCAAGQEYGPKTDPWRSIDDPLVQDMDEVTMMQVLPYCSKIKYIYDFGDFWELEIKLKKRHKPIDWDRPVCLDGARAGPLEDCGGCFGYAECAQIARGEIDDAERKEWCGSWDPEIFDRDACNQRLSQLYGGAPLCTSPS